MNSETAKNSYLWIVQVSAVLIQHRRYLSFFGIPTSTIDIRFGEDRGSDLSYWLWIPILVGFLWLIRDISINSSLMTWTVYEIFFQVNCRTNLQLTGSERVDINLPFRSPSNDLPVRAFRNEKLNWVPFTQFESHLASISKIISKKPKKWENA